MAGAPGAFEAEPEGTSGAATGTETEAVTGMRAWTEGATGVDADEGAEVGAAQTSSRPLHKKSPASSRGFGGGRYKI